MSEELKPCPFCNSGIKPSPGLPGVYQHAENVDTCIIGDLGIKDLVAWNRRASPTPEGGDDRENLMERAREIAADDLSAMTASWLDTQAFARALLSSPRVEEVRREALNDALFDLLELAIDVRVEGASIVLFHCSSGAAKARLAKAQTALSPPVVKETK